MDTAEIARAFNIKPVHITKNKYYYIITSGNTEYKLYSTDMTTDDINILYNIKKHLKEKDIPTDMLVCSNGKPYFTADDNTYIALKTVKGNCLCHSSKKDVLKAAEAIGTVHKTMEDFQSPQSVLNGKDYEKAVKLLMGIRSTICRKNKKNKADMLFMSSFKDICQVCTASGNIIAQCIKEEKPIYIHGSLKEENIIMNNKTALVNSSGVIADSPMKDLSGFIKRYVKKYALDSDTYVSFYDIVNAYAKHRALSQRETELLKALTRFPDKYIKVFGEYYKHPKPFTPVYIPEKIGQCMRINGFMRDYAVL